MADSVPKLRRMLNEANERIRELESRKPDVVKVESRKVVEVPVEVFVDRVIEKPVPFEVRTAYYPPSVVRVEVPVVEYVDNPDLIETIRQLQEKLCQFTSQSDL